MKAAVIVFPGSNCDRDVRVALSGCGADTTMVWHGNSELPEVDLVVIPGGFSYGDYLRSGAMAAHSPIMREIKRHDDEGRHILGICNGFQILTETGLLPGMLLRNNNLKFICKDVSLRVENSSTAFTSGYKENPVATIPIAHHDGNFFASDAQLEELEEGDQIAFRYADSSGAVNDNINPNGSMENIAGILNRRKNILGLMPHPERNWEPVLGNSDGRILFDSLLESFRH